MKKSALKILLITVFLISFGSCKSTKRGCGLTSDSQKMEQTTAAKALTLAEV